MLSPNRLKRWVILMAAATSLFSNSAAFAWEVGETVVTQLRHLRAAKRIVVDESPPNRTFQPRSVVVEDVKWIEALVAECETDGEPLNLKNRWRVLLFVKVPYATRLRFSLVWAHRILVGPRKDRRSS
jgi:hypothetical protein